MLDRITIVSVNTGARVHPKRPVPANRPIKVLPKGLHGDRCAVADDPNFSVVVFPEDGYPLGKEFGFFGENFTVRGATEGSVSLGDQWRIGGVVFEIVTPHMPLPCLRVLGRHERESFRAKVSSMGYQPLSGWCLKVLQPGTFTRTDALTIVPQSSRPHFNCSVSHAFTTSLKYAPARRALGH